MTKIKGRVKAGWLENGASIHGERSIGLTVVREVVIGGQKRYGCVSVEAFGGESPMNDAELDEDEPEVMSGDASILLDVSGARRLAGMLLSFADEADVVQRQELRKAAERKAKRRAARASARASAEEPAAKGAARAKKAKAKPRAKR